MNKTILSFEKYTMLNESFKSKIISRLFQEGEIDTEDVYQKSLFNQVTDDEIIGIADDEEAAKKWLATGAQPTEVVAKLLKIAGIEK